MINKERKINIDMERKKYRQKDKKKKIGRLTGKN